MSQPARLPWSDAPRFSGVHVGARNRLAARTAWSAGVSSFVFAGVAVDVQLARRLDGYPIVLSYTSSGGELRVGIEVAAIFPEYARDVLAVLAGTDASRLEWADWLGMTWTDLAEAWLGFALTLTGVELDAAMPADSVALRIQAAGQRRGHVALAGSALAHLDPGAPARRPSEPAWPAWTNDTLTWVVRIPGLAREEIGRIAKGAVMLARLTDLACYVGPPDKGIRMNAKWNEAGSVALSGRDDPDHDRLGSLGEERLVNLAELDFDVDVLLGTRSVTLGELERMTKGSVFELDRPTVGREVALACRGRIFARGEIVDVDDRLGVLITDCASPWA